MKSQVELVRREQKEDGKRAVLMELILFYIARHDVINFT
jgi:hypothetical protein